MDHLVLRIDELPRQDAAGYPIRLIRITPGGEEQDPPLAEATLPKDWSGEGPLRDPATGAVLDLDLTPQDLRAFVLHEKDDADALDGVGVLLHRLLLRDAVGTAWEAVWEAARQAASGLRVHLDVRPAALRMVPWELMQQHPDPPLFLHQQLALVRGKPVTAAPAPCLGPLRVLIVVACDPDGASAGGEAIAWSSEVQALKKTFREQRQLFDYCVLHRPPRDAPNRPWSASLRKALREWKPHIFHFIGHGFAEEGSEAYLEFAAEAGSHDAWMWTVSDILQDLQGSDALRLAFINACHSTVPTNQEGTWSVAQAFLQHGTPAVLAMQGAVSGKAAAIYGPAVYHEIARGRSIDAALHWARDSVKARTAQDGLLARDWSLASLTVQTPVEDALSLPTGIGVDEWPTVRDMFDRLKAAPLKDFVDRDEHRRRVWGVIDTDLEPRSSLLILKGEQEIGKTTMLAWCLEACSVRRHSVAYRDCRGSESADFLDVMRYIRTGTISADFPARLQQRIRPEEAFAPFHRSLNLHLRPDGTPPPPDDAIDHGYPLRPDHERTIPSLAASFVDSLSRAAQGGALTIALDNLGGVDPSHFKKYIVPYVLLPIAGGLAANLHVVLAVTDEQYDDRQLGLGQLAFEPRTTEITLDRFAKQDYPLLAADLLSAYQDAEFIDQLVPLLMQPIPARWKPTRLGLLRRIVQEG